MKPESITLSVVDFFAAFTPGVVVIAAVWALWPDAFSIAALEGADEARVVAFFAVSYSLGAVLNAIGSRTLDAAFAQSHGPTDGASPEAALRSAVEAHLDDAGIAAATVKSDEGTKNYYESIRPFLRRLVPSGESEVEQLEAEQKLFRTSTVASVVLALALVAANGLAGALPALGLLTVSWLTYDRYVTLRKKTVRRAYQHFVLHFAPSKEKRAASRRGHRRESTEDGGASLP